ncbi:hypothetical protein ACPA54_17475 [Uniformispora flossi]
MIRHARTGSSRQAQERGHAMNRDPVLDDQRLRDEIRWSVFDC